MAQPAAPAAPTAATRRANLRETIRTRIYGFRLGDNTMISDLDATVTVGNQVVGAHLTMMIDDVLAQLAAADAGDNPATVVTAMNAADYHVTFRMWDADYDARNPRYYSNSGTWGPAVGNRTAQARSIIDAGAGGAIGRARDAALQEAAGMQVRELTQIERAHRGR